MKPAIISPTTRVFPIQRYILIVMLLLVSATLGLAQPALKLDRAKILKTAQDKYGITPANANISEQELISEIIKKGIDINDADAVEEAAVEIIRARQAKAQKAKASNSPSGGAKATPSGGGGAKKSSGAAASGAGASNKAVKQNDAFKKVPTNPNPTPTVSNVVVKADNKVKVVSAPPAVYGQDIPSNVSLQVDPKSINPKGSYVIGIGDKFGISVYGERADDFTMEVNDEGYAMIPDVPGSRVYLKGLTYEKAKKALKARLGRFYNYNVATLEINLVYARTVTVHIMGEVNFKGTQVLSGVNTALNALAASQGLTKIASVRNIKLIRSGEADRTIDIYKYMSDPAYGEGFYLQDNDYIIVPTLGKVVTIKGEVNRPMKYELIQGEKIKDLIEYAAGLKPNAYTKNITLERIENNEVKVINIDLQSILNGSPDVELKNGDIISISPINPYNKDIVTLNGEFLYPGEYALVAGQKLDYYLNKAQIKEEARIDTAYITRKYVDGTVSYIKVNIEAILANPNVADNIVLLPLDQVQLTSKAGYIENFDVSLSGDVRSGSVSRQFDSTLTIRDMIFLAGGLKPTFADLAVITRTNRVTGLTDYIFFRVSDVMTGSNLTNDTLNLQPQDRIKIFNKSSKIEKFDITVGGAVRSPSTFAFNEALTLKDLLYMADGLKLNASNKLIIVRTNLQTLEKEYIDVNLDDLLIPNSPLNQQIELFPADRIEVLSSRPADEYTIRIDGLVRKPGSFEWGPGLKLGDVIILSGGIKPEATGSRVEISRVVLKPNGGETEVIVAQFEIGNNQELVSGSDFELEKYDQIVVRSAPDFELQRNVSIQGEVKYPGRYPLLGKNETLLSLINRAGGLTTEAFPSGATFNRSLDEQGKVLLDLEDVLKKKERSVYNYILKEGDVIIIPRAIDLIVLQGSVDNPVVADAGQINIPFHKGKRAGFYVNRYGQGVDWENDARRRYITVEYPNGDRREALNLGLFVITPKVKPGSKIVVGTKPPKKPKPKKQEGEKKEVDWGQVVANAVTQITAVLTLYVLLQQVL